MNSQQQKTTEQELTETTPIIVNNNISRRGFLNTIATVAVWALWILELKESNDIQEKILKTVTTSEKINGSEVNPESKDYDHILNSAIENLIDAYEVIELDLVQRFYTYNYTDDDLNNLISILTAIKNTRDATKINKKTQEKINTIIYMLYGHPVFSYSEIESAFANTDIFEKKYPQLIPLIKERKRKN